MRSRRDNEKEEFELYQNNHAQLIKTNLSRLEKNKTLKNVNQDPKEFLYLLAALLKRGIPFSVLYLKARHYLAGQIRGFLLYQTDEYNHLIEDEVDRAQRRNQLLDQVPFIPLIAHDVCSFEELQTWFNFQKIKEPDNAYYQIINRMQLYDKIKFEYFGNSWTIAGKKKGVKQLRDEILDALLVQAKEDEPLCSDILALQQRPLSFKKLGTCVECADAEKIQHIILRLNDVAIKKLDPAKSANNDIYRQTLHSSPLLFSGKGQSVSLDSSELAHAKFYGLSQ